MPPDTNYLRSDEARRSFQSKNHNGVENQHMTSIPAHVNVVKDGLLDFNRFVGLDAVLQLLCDEEPHNDDEAIPLHAFKASAVDAKSSQRARDREFLENAQKFSKGAQRLENGFAEDNEWRSLFRTAVNHRMDEFHSSVSILPSTIACSENETWNTNLEPSRDLQTTSKPDLCFGFPVHNEEYQQSSGFRKDPSLQHYTIRTLSQLALKGLHSGPISDSISGAAELKRDSTVTQLCFPWCVVQLEGAEQVMTIADNEKLVSETFHHASIAASDALVLLEKLARFADVKQDGQHIPPVVAITSVGANTTVWLTFSAIVDDKYRSHKMLSIWNGRVSKIWDAIQFCRIMDNIFVWSQHILRPKVTQYIDQWKLHYCPEVPSQHSDLEKDPETADLIHRIQDRLSLLSISPNSNLTELIQQAVILQEVMRSNSPNPEQPSVERLVPNAQEEIGLSTEVSSRPTPDILSTGASGSSLLKRGVQNSHQFKGKEDKKAEDHLKGESGDFNEDYSVRSEDNLPLRQTLHKTNAFVLHDPEIILGVSTSVESMATRSKQGQPDIKGKSSTPTTETLLAGPSEKLSTSKKFSKTKSHLDSGNEEKCNSGATFMYSHVFKTSDFDFNEDESVSYSHKSKSTDTNAMNRQPRRKAPRTMSQYAPPLMTHRIRVLAFSHDSLRCRVNHQRSLAGSKKHTTGKNLSSKIEFDDCSGSSSTSSAQPNPFVSKFFQLSFDIKHWWAIVPEGPTRQFDRDPDECSKVPRYFAPTTEINEKTEANDPHRFYQYESPNRNNPGCHQADTPIIPVLDIRVPWKGASIRVKLPPAIPPKKRFGFMSPQTAEKALRKLGVNPLSES